MKICTVVLTYDDPLYNHFDRIKRNYLSSKNEDFYFVYNGLDDTKHNLSEKQYNYKTDIYNSSGIPVMFDKFIDIVKSGLLDEYDFVIRVNSSTFINVDKLREELSTKNTQVYMGFFYPDWQFVSGACTIFSQDVLKKLVSYSNSISTCREDDVVIGEIMSHLSIPKTFLDRYCFESHIQDTHITVPSIEEIEKALTFPQIRIRNNSNRDLIDCGIWNNIESILQKNSI